MEKRAIVDKARKTERNMGRLPGIVAGLAPAFVEFKQSLAKDVAPISLRYQSAGETAAIQKCLLFGCGGTAEHGVAVREPAEAANDIGVYFGPFEIFRVSNRLVESDSELLIGEIFRVFKGKIEKAPQLLCNLTVETFDNGSRGYGTGETVGG